MVQPAVQWVSDTAWRKRLQTTPYHVMMGREPRTAFTTLIEGHEEGFQVSPTDENRLQQLVFFLVDIQEAPGNGAATRRRRSSSQSSARQLRQDSAAFHGRRLHYGSLSVQAGQAPQAHEHLDRAVACCQRRQRARVCGAAHGHKRPARRPIAKMEFYADDQLEITGELLKAFQQLGS